MTAFLHVGCGPVGNPVPTMFLEYDELRMDIDPAVDPDMVGSITAIDLPDESVNGVYASHVLEHVESWEIQRALAEVYRVLKPGGSAVILTPDLVAWAKEIVANPGAVEDVTPGTMGPVAPLDALFGYQPEVQAGKEYMRHRMAFTQLTLAAHLQAAGFASARVVAQHWQLCAVARKGVENGEESSC